MASHFAHPEDAKTLGSTLRLARQSRGWTQGKLSKECGFDRTQISKVENGQARTQNYCVQEMCKVLGIPLSGGQALANANALASRIEALGKATPRLLPALDAVLSALEIATIPESALSEPSK